jgi:hypothetical protein
VVDIATTANYLHLNWDVFCILKELSFFDADNQTRLMPHIPHNEEMWGTKNYFWDENNNKNYFVSEIAKVSRYGMAFVGDIDDMLNLIAP